MSNDHRPVRHLISIAPVQWLGCENFVWELTCDGLRPAHGIRYAPVLYYGLTTENVFNLKIMAQKIHNKSCQWWLTVGDVTISLYFYPHIA